MISICSAARRRKKREGLLFFGITVVPEGSREYDVPPLPSRVSVARIERSKPRNAGESGGVRTTGLPDASNEIEMSGGFSNLPVGTLKA